MAGGLLVTGATGFLGRYIVPELARRYPSVACLVRPSSDTGWLQALGLELRMASLGDERALRHAFRSIDTLVNLASLGFGHAPGLVRAAMQAKVRRGVFMGTTAIFSSLPARTRPTRLQAEVWIRESGLAYTVLRPTMIYGSERDRNIARLIRYLRRYAVIFVPGSGEGLQQPVFVTDVAQAVVAALERPESVGKCYNLAGPSPLSLNQLIDLTAQALHRPVRRVHLSPGLVALAARLGAALRLPLGVSVEQLVRVAEDKVFSIRDARQELGFDPIPFEEGVRREIAEMYGSARPAPPQLEEGGSLSRPSAEDWVESASGPGGGAAR